MPDHHRPLFTKRNRITISALIHSLSLSVLYRNWIERIHNYQQEREREGWFYTFTESNFLCVITSLAEEENSAKGFRRGVVVVREGSFRPEHFYFATYSSFVWEPWEDLNDVTATRSRRPHPNKKKKKKPPAILFIPLLLFFFFFTINAIDRDLFAPFQHAQLNCTCKYKKILTSSLHTRHTRNLSSPPTTTSLPAFFLKWIFNESFFFFLSCGCNCINEIISLFNNLGRGK